MFVDRNWHHTVLHEDTSEAVITIVARRGGRNKPTTVLSDPDGGAKEPEVNTVDSELSDIEKNKIFAIFPYNVKLGGHSHKLILMKKSIFLECF